MASASKRGCGVSNALAELCPTLVAAGAPLAQSFETPQSDHQDRLRTTRRARAQVLCTPKLLYDSLVFLRGQGLPKNGADPRRLERINTSTSSADGTSAHNAHLYNACRGDSKRRSDSKYLSARGTQADFIQVSAGKQNVARVLDRWRVALARGGQDDMAPSTPTIQSMYIPVLLVTCDAGRCRAGMGDAVG